MDEFYFDIPLIREENFLTILLITIFIFSFIFIVFIIFRAIYRWFLFKKMGREGWESLVPIYNKIIEIETLDMPSYMVILLFIPPLTLLVNVLISINVGRKFDKDTGFIVGLILLPIIFYPILVFGNSQFNKDNDGLFDKRTGYCVNCGSKVNGNFCYNCGKSTKLN